jgi:hypothetical protein
VFRADNPQLSSLRLADGPLTGYDLEGLSSPPRVVVLSACDAGLTGVRSGEEVQGLVAALLTLGTDAVIAAVAPVADDLTAAFALDLHACLSDGVPPPSALARVQHDWSGRGVREVVTATSFVCFGGGHPAAARHAASRAARRPGGRHESGLTAPQVEGSTSAW